MDSVSSVAGPSSYLVSNNLETGESETSSSLVKTVSVKKFIFRSKKRCGNENVKNTNETVSDDDDVRKETLPISRRCFIIEGSSTTEESEIFGNDDDIDFDTLVVIIPERMQASYGLYVWPGAPILAWYLYEHRQFIQRKRILELGAGTALPGVVAALCGASKVILTDSAQLPHCLEQARKSIEANHLENSPNIEVRGLTWGTFLSSIVKLKGQVDLLIGSDCFYDPSVFEDLLSTVSYILENNPGCSFLTTYQERSSDWSIVSLLNKWGLECKHIPLNELANSCEIDLLQLMQDHTIHLLEIRVKTTPL